MNDVFIVSSDSEVSSNCKTILGYRNVLNETIAAGQDEDADYPLELAFDYSYHTEYSPDLTVAASSVEIIFTLATVEDLNYFGIISKNAQESELSVVVDVYSVVEGDYVEVAAFGSMTNAVPKMVYFGDDFEDGSVSSLLVRVTLNYTAKPYIMSIMCGEAIVFPRTFSLGFQPAHLSYLDEVRQFNADEGLNLVGGRRLARGKQLEGKINYVRMTFIEDFWDEFSNHVLDSKPVMLMWNSQLTDQVIYGAQDPNRLTKPKYKTSLFGELDFNIAGWA